MAILIQKPTKDNNRYEFFKVFQMSGEIGYTYYADKNGNIFKLCDWIGSEPELTTQSEIFKLAMILFGLSPLLILEDFNSWKLRVE